MTFKELFEGEKFQEIFQEIDKFSHNKLDVYIEKLKTRELDKGSKEIFDAVWGNVEFSNGEIYILDSPLLQRLRGIKQLGLAYFVYCGCDYSRFYHTIGVTYLADRMASAINRCELDMSEDKKEYFRIVVRLAAIFHDVGHMFFSHVSEHYFGKSPLYPRITIVQKMLDEVKRKAKKEVSLHELLSCMIVNTESVKMLLECVVEYLDDEISTKSYDIEEVVEYISCLIIGIPIDRYVLPYSNIINGPIDADKCDYLSRDSHVTRVPVAVDISRITQKLSVVETHDVNMSQLWHGDAEEKRNLYVLAMKDSAEKALFQLCIARTIMFDSVYYHHKVLTAETGFRHILNRLANLDKPLFTSFSEILEYSDGDLNTYFFDALRKDREEKDCKCLDNIETDLKEIYDRELAKRIVCLMPEYLEGTQDKIEALFDDVLTSVDSQEEKSFLEFIKKEYIEICKILGKDEQFTKDINLMLIQAPTIVFGHSKIQVPIDLRNGNKREFRGYELVSSRETSSSASYIVTSEKEKILMLMAVQKVLYEKYNIKIKDEALACGKYKKKELSVVRNQLFMKGFYDRMPYLISDDLLYNNHLSEHSIKQLVKKYSTYEGPDGYQVTELEVKRFFKQVLSFCKDKNNCVIIIEGIYKLLYNGVFINRDYFSKNIDKLLEQLDYQDEVLYVVPLGNLQDSAKHMMYFWNDRKKEQYSIQTEKKLEEILEDETTRQIVFFDDGSFSGKQLVSIMQEYMGVKKVTKEHHVEELPEVLKPVLCSKKLIFFFIAFNKSNESELKKELSELGLVDVTFLYINDMSVRCLEESENSIFEDDNQQNLVRDFLQDVGYLIMKSAKSDENGYKEGWNEERVKGAALGYNNAQQVVFLKSSVPTYTIVAFWQKGELSNGVQWEPLFLRTQK